MDNAAGVGRSETVSDLQCVVERLALSDWAACKEVTKGLAFEEFGNQVGSAVSSNFVNDEDVRMIQRGECFCFRLEAAKTAGIGNEISRKNLQSDFPVEAGVWG